MILLWDTDFAELTEFVYITDKRSLLDPGEGAFALIVVDFAAEFSSWTKIEY